MIKRIVSIGPIHSKFILLCLVVFSFSACATARDKKLTEAIPLSIIGAYEGNVSIKDETMKITIFNISTEGLSSYKNVRPLTGGNRVLLFFDTDLEIPHAEYCAFIYSDEVVFRKGGRVDWYIKEIATLEYVKESGDIHFNIPSAYFDYKPFKVWTQKTN